MKKVLIIEDDDAIRENTAELLELHKYKVLTAQDGRTGFEAARKFVPDIILCDMMMPDTDGRAFLRLAKANDITSNIPLIFFSAGSLPKEIQQQISTGNNAFLKKPFTEDQLLTAIKNCCNAARNLNTSL